MALVKFDDKAKMSRKALERAGENTDERLVNAQTVVDFRTADDCIAAIRSVWERSQQNFITIGRYLLRAKEVLEHGEYDLMIKTRLPFSRSLAYMMRRVAEAIDTRMIEEARCPTDYTTAYHLVSLTPEQLALADSRELVKPDLTRREIMEFRKELTGGVQKVSGAPKSPKALLKRKTRIEAQMQALQAELDEINRTLGGRTIDGVATTIDVDEG